LVTGRLLLGLIDTVLTFFPCTFSLPIERIRVTNVDASRSFDPG